MFLLSRVVLTILKRATINIKSDFILYQNHCYFDRMLTGNSIYITKHRMCSKPNYTEDEENIMKLKLGEAKVKLKLAFTCKKCSTRNHKFISKIAYERGLVIVTCEGCKNNHLIADNLGWFEEWKGIRNIETFLKNKGESICRIRNNVEGYFEAMTKNDIIKFAKEKSEIEEKHKCEDDKIK